MISLALLTLTFQEIGFDWRVVGSLNSGYTRGVSTEFYAIHNKHNTPVYHPTQEGIAGRG